MEDKETQIRRIMLSLNRIDEIYYRWGRRVGLKENMLALLYALSDGGHYTQKQISEEWLIPKTTINTIVKECVRSGHVVLRHEPHSKEKLICLTDAGREYTEEVLRTLKQAEMQAFDETVKKCGAGITEVFEEFADRLKEACEAAGPESPSSEENVD